MQESRLYSFINQESNMALHFLEGQKVIHDLVLTHNLGPSALEYHRNTVLSSLQMLYFMKAGENLGIYIDSEEPYFRFKLELANSGQMRTLLLPEEFKEFPQQISGKVRLTKQFPKSAPYTSIIDVDHLSSSDLINTILERSYQTHAKITISPSTDQSVMITKLPGINSKIISDDDEDIEKFFNKKVDVISDAFNEILGDIERIVQFFENDGFVYLASKEIKFHCGCSRDRMIYNLSRLHLNDKSDLFEKEQIIEVRCDYCNTVYEISKNDLHRN